MKKILSNVLILLAFLGVFAFESKAQSSADITVSGTLYNAFNDPCTSCTFTVTVTRRDGVAVQSTARTVTSHASTGAVSFTLPRKSFVTFTGNYTVGRYNWRSGISMFLPDQSTIDIVDIQSVEDAAAALVAVSAAPSDAQYVVGTANGTLSAEQNLGALTTGLLLNTVASSVGTLSTATAGTHYVAPGATTTSGLTMATARILGRSTASTGAIEEISIGSGLSLSGGTLSTTSSGGTWGSITGTLSNQTDLQSALDLKAPLISPSFTTPTLGAASATSINKVALTAPATGSTLTIADGKTLTASNTITLTATDGSTLAIGTGGTLGSAAYTASSAYEVPLTFSTGLTRSTNTITVNTSQNIATLSNLTSNGLVTTSGGDGTLGVTVPGSGVLTALAVNTGSAGAFVVNGGAGGTPSSLTCTNCTGLPLSTGVTGDLPFANFVQAGSAGFVGATGAGDYSHRTPTQVTAALDSFVGDSGSGGTKGLVPAPASGDSGKYLKGDGTWATVSASPGGSSGVFQINSAGSFGAATGVSYASSGAPTVSITGQSTTQLTSYFLGPNTSSNAITAIQLGTGGSSGNFVEYRNSSGTALSVVDSTGALGLGITSSFGGRLHVVGGASGVAGRFDGAALSTNTVLVARQGSSSTGNLLEAQTSGGTAFFTIANGGQITSSLPVTTGTGATAGFQVTANSLTTGNGVEVSSSSVSSGNVVSIAATGTAAASNTKTALNVSTSGANATSTQTTYGARISNTSTGTSSTNYGLNVAVSGATTNIPINIDVTASTTVPAIAFNNETNAGFLYSSGGQFGILSAGGERIRVNVLGIGVLGQIGLGSTAGSPDVLLTRVAAAGLRFGAADAASPVAQTLSVQNVVAGTSNTAGVTWTHQASLGTGNAAPGRHSFTTGAISATSGTTQQAAVSRLELGATKVLTNNSATTLVNVTNASNTNAGGVLDYCIEVIDASNELQYECGMVTYGVTNKGGVWSGNTATKFGNHQNATSGTLTVTFAISGANPALLSVNANSSLTPSTGFPRITYSLRNNTQQAVAIQ